MTQYQQVLEALRKIGGQGTLEEIYNAIDGIDSWGAKNKKASVSSYLCRGFEIRKYDNTYICIFADETEGAKYFEQAEKSNNLYCTDGYMQTAKVKKSKKGYKIMVLPNLHEKREMDYKKVLFDTIFDEIMIYNSMSGIGYAAVKKDGLWGLIRYRQNCEFSYDKEAYRKATEIEPFDQKAMDKLGREIKLVEDIKYQDFNHFVEKYHLDKLNEKYGSTYNAEQVVESQYKREWSKDLIEYTKDAFSNLEFGFSPEGTVRMKRNDSSFGYIPLKDALSNRYNVHHDEGGFIDEYNDISDMIANGWVLD